MITPRENNVFIGNNEAEKQLLHDLNAGQLKHSYIISGQPGVGKETLAFRFIRHVIAGNTKKNLSTLDMAKDSPVFQIVLSGATPNLIEIQLEKIGIDNIRDIIIKLALKVTGKRIVLINNADSMNKAASNALLKILEEPPSETTFILLTTNYYSIIPTIRSRSVHIHINKLNDDEAVAALKLLSINEDLFYICNGSIGNAAALQNSGGINFYKNIISNLLSGKIYNNSEITDNYPLFEIMLFNLLERSIYFNEGALENYLDEEIPCFNLLKKGINALYPNINNFFFGVKSLSLDKGSALLWLQESLKQLRSI